MQRPARRRSWTRLAAPALVFALVGLTAAPTLAAPPAQSPDSNQQPLTDGCQRSDAMQLTVTSPEWVYVNRADVLQHRLAGDATAGRQTVEGTVDDTHPAGDDLYINHDYNDLDIGVKPNPAYAGLAATGNGGDLGLEWEEALVPQWAWPQVGDGIKASGSWIWDCGHWGNGPADETGLSELLPYDPEETLKDLANPGTIRGEQTELHPLYELATFRKDAAGFLTGVHGARDLQHLDVWISGDGGPALASEECSLYGVPNGSAFSPACNRYRDVGGTYTYTMNLGPAPAAGSRIVVDPVEVHPETDAALRSVPVKVTTDPAVGTATVSFTLPHGTPPERYGISVFAGWSKAPRAVAHVVTLKSITVNATLDGPTEPNINPVTSPTSQQGNQVLHEQTPDPGEWVMFAQVNGHWWQLPPSMMSAVTAGTTYQLDHTWQIWLPAGVAPTIYVSGRECDIPLINCALDQYGAPPRDPASPFSEAGFNDKPGRIEFGNTGLPLSPGEWVYQPVVNPVPTSTSEDYSDAACGGPCYSVDVTAG